MSTASLINMNDPLWVFEEAMAHRTLLGGMSPLDRFSVLPYLLDPMVDLPFWRLNQQTAQDDAIRTLGVVSIPAPQPLQDNKLDTPTARTWFSFVDEQEMRIAESTLPSPLLPAW